MARAFAGLAVGSTLGCASTPRPTPPRLARAALCGTEATLSVPRDGGDASVAWLSDAVAHADARLQRFDLGLAEPLLIRLHPTIASFVDATGRTEPWLRAWSGWATVDLLALRFWDDDSTAARRERLTHEVSHCALFQRFGTREAAMRARIPWWFLEGSASVIAEQGARRMPLPTVLEKATGNPLGAAAPAAEQDPALAYGAAHHAMAALCARHGERAIRRILDDAVATGDELTAALTRTLGEDAEQLWSRLSATR
jgi:hypothetical protein